MTISPHSIPLQPPIACQCIVAFRTSYACTMLSRLFFEVSVGAHNISLINTFGGIVLAIAVADGVFMGLKYFLLEIAAMFCGLGTIVAIGLFKRFLFLLETA